MISGIQHFVFCKRQWALIHIEKLWDENYFTIDGQIKHERVDDYSSSITRNGVHEIRALPVSSAELGVSGQCDVVEFRPTKNGVFIPRLNDSFSILPIEYKRGRPKNDLSDKLQLMTQAMCLEDMLLTRIERGALFYFETRRRDDVTLSEELRNQARKIVSEMHRWFDSGTTPKVRKTAKCKRCSLANLCIPELEACEPVSEYIMRSLGQ